MLINFERSFADFCAMTETSSRESRSILGVEDLSVARGDSKSSDLAGEITISTLRFYRTNACMKTLARPPGRQTATESRTRPLRRPPSTGDPPRDPIPSAHPGCEKNPDTRRLVLALQR